MGHREVEIAKSIIYSILTANDDGLPSRPRSWVDRLRGFFYLYRLLFNLVRADLFHGLRQLWNIKAIDYKRSFGTSGEWKTERKSKETSLEQMGDMGFSGSTFYRTRDGSYLIKSVPRRFEHNFFKQELLTHYVDHMHSNPSSLLVRITDFLECAHTSIGSILGLAPSHHVIMENLLYGQEQALEDGTKPKWESFDLKPMSYFYPERDVAGGALTSEATKNKLADKFDGKLRLGRDEAEAFKAQLEKDTKLLADRNAVDYSLFLVRASITDAAETQAKSKLARAKADENVVPQHPPFVPPGPPTWRTGITSTDGKEFYRAAVLDFFWAKHSVTAKAMTGLIQTYNVVDEQGPMSITTTAAEYRERFLNMCLDMIEVEGGAVGFNDHGDGGEGSNSQR